MVQVDRSYNAREVTLALGDVLEISLAENRTAGFRWELKIKPEPTCSLIKDLYDAPATVPARPGEGGTHRWQFRAVHPGTGEIKLEYRRHWQQEKPLGQTFELSVHVR